VHALVGGPLSLDDLPENIVPLLQIFITIDLTTGVAIIENRKARRPPRHMPFRVTSPNPGERNPDDAYRDNSN
jgi:hypothetical protein